MSGIRDFLVAFALALGATLTVAWDGLLGYGLFRPFHQLRQLSDIGHDAVPRFAPVAPRSRWPSSWA